MGTRAQVGALIGRVGFHIAKERLTRPRPVTLREVPPSADSLTHEWLTRALCDGEPLAAVTAFELGHRNDGTSARRTLKVQYNDPGQWAGLPEHLFTKSTPTFLTRMVGAGVGLSRVEAMFYAHVRRELDIETPVVRYSAYDAVSHRQLLIVDDVSVTRGARFGSVLDRTLTREQAEQVVDLLANLHAHFWEEPLQRWYGSWLEDAYEITATLNTAIGAEARIQKGFERGRAVIPPAVYARRAEVHPALMRSQQLNVTVGPQTLLHGDVHPGNWYVAADGRMGIYDWQLAVRGGPARDLAYALSTHLTVEQRREWESDLLERYLEQIAKRGVDIAPTHEDLFLYYRQQMTYPMLAWLATLGRSPLQPKYQPDDIALANLARVTTAFDDLDTLEAVGA